LTVNFFFLCFSLFVSFDENNIVSNFDGDRNNLVVITTATRTDGNNHPSVRIFLARCIWNDYAGSSLFDWFLCPNENAVSERFNP